MDRAGAQDGFTLIELMVVVLIIGVLVAIAIPMFNAARERAELNTCLSNQRTIESSVQQYLGASLPMWTTGGVLDGNGTADSPDALVPSYLKAAPKCPFTGLRYFLDTAGTVTGDTSSAAFAAPHHGL